MGEGSEEGEGAAVEVEALGGGGEERKRESFVWGGENEVLDSDDFEQVLVLVHEFLESWIDGARGNVLRRCGFGASARRR